MLPNLKTCFNEAPANLPGNHPERAPRVGRHGGASMKPRQICRGTTSFAALFLKHLSCFNEAPANLPGNLGGNKMAKLSHRASMKPRQICRGTAWAAAAAFGPSQSFNEAPANLPGNLRGYTQVVDDVTQLQ